MKKTLNWLCILKAHIKYAHTYTHRYTHTCTPCTCTYSHYTQACRCTAHRCTHALTRVHATRAHTATTYVHARACPHRHTFPLRLLGALLQEHPAILMLGCLVILNVIQVYKTSVINTSCFTSFAESPETFLRLVAPTQWPPASP